MGNKEIKRENTQEKNPEVSTLYYRNGEYYVGATVQNARNGFGTYYYQNGDKYEGNWCDNLKHGKGTFFYNKTGEMYEGNFNNNKREGMGIFFYKNGDRYQGEWKDDVRHGKGVLYLATGGKFVGQFKYDQKDGIGELIDKNGQILYEEWSNGKLINQSNKMGFEENDKKIKNIDYFNEFNANKFQKFLNNKTQKQYENKTNMMKSKYFFLEIVKKLKGKNNDKIENIKNIQNTANILVEKPDVAKWTNDDIVDWFKKIDYEKYVDKIIESNIDGTKLLNLDNNGIINLFGINDKNEILNISKNIEMLKNVLIKKYEKNNEEIEENANSEEDDDENSLKKKFKISIEDKINTMPLKSEEGKKKKLKDNDNISNVNLLQELTKQSKYFYSSINVNGLSYYIDYDEISNVKEKIGQGGFGEVFLCQWQGKKVAIKTLTLKNFKNLHAGDNLQKFINEINISSSLRHPNIVLYMGASVDKDNYYMITEYVPRGTLFDLIHTEKYKLSDRMKIKIAFQLAQAVKYLHSRNIAHCDLKSGNILLDDELNVKLGDFGLSRFLSKTGERDKGRIGTPHWMAPEILLGGKYEFYSDVFSYGIILWELLTYEIPYNNIDPNVIVDLITKEKKIVKVPDKGNYALRKITQKCIEYNPFKRPSFKNILSLLAKVRKNDKEYDQSTQDIFEFIM